MSNKPSEEGYGAGYNGEAKDNPYETGLMDRAFLGIMDVIIPGNDGLERADQAAEDYDKSYDAGVADRLSGR